METLIGNVIHYYNHLGVAIIVLENDLRIGDTLIFRGHTTELTQIVCSIEVEHQKRIYASQGMTIAVAVDEPVREGDRVYKQADEGEDPQNKALWVGMLKSVEIIQNIYEPVFAHFMHTNGVDDHTITVLLAAVTFDPDVVSPEKLQVRGPYTSKSAWMEWLFKAAGKGYFSEPEPGEFRLTQNGQFISKLLIEEARTAMSRAEPLPVSDCQRIASLLGRLVQASLFSTAPPDNWSIRLSYQLMPPEDPPLPYVDQALSCLQAYRDDAHLAAWQPAGLTAPAFEALTLLWRGSANSLEMIYNRLAYRGFEYHDYQAAIDELRQRRMLEGSDSALVISPSGSAFRNQVEQITDRYFFKPWNCLSSEEKTELACLLMLLRNGLAVIIESA